MTEPVEDHSILPEVEEAISDFLDQGERWQETARIYAQNADYWRSRFDAIAAEVERIAKALEMQADEWDRPFRTGPLAVADQLRSAIDGTRVDSGNVSAATQESIAKITGGMIKNSDGLVPFEDRESYCVERWPECFSGGYDPRCCRFPKSCSCEIFTDEQKKLIKMPSSDFPYYPLQGEPGPDTPRPKSSEVYGLPKICEIPDCGCAGNAHP